MYLETKIKKLSVANKNKLLKGLPIKICIGNGDCIILTKTQQKNLLSKSSMELFCSEAHCKKLHNFYNKDLLGGGVGSSRRVVPEPNFDNIGLKNKSKPAPKVPKDFIMPTFNKRYEANEEQRRETNHRKDLLKQSAIINPKPVFKPKSKPKTKLAKTPQSLISARKIDAEMKNSSNNSSEELDYFPSPRGI
jgi:hypothetical protein